MIGKGLLLFVEEGATDDGDYYLKMLKNHLYVVRRLSFGQKFTIQKYGGRCHTANFISERKIDLLILVTSIYLIMQFGTS